MPHQNPKHHKWYVDPGWSPPGFFMLQLEFRGQNQSTYTPVSTIAAVWKQLKELLLGNHVEELMTKSIKRACKWFSASQPNAPSSSPERTRTYQEDLLPYASVQDPPLSNVYEYVPTLATNTGSVPKISTEVSQLNEKSTNEISLFIILLRLFLPNCLFCCAVKSCRSASTKEMACSSRVTAKMLCFRRWSRAAFITWGQGCRSLLN